MTKHILCLSVCLGALHVVAAPVHAESTLPAANAAEQRRMQVQQNVEERQQLREERAETVKQNVEERKQQRQENVEARQEQRQDRRADFARQHAERLEKRFALYTDRLEKLIEKTITRVESLESSGRDVTLARQHIAEAEAALKDAQNAADQSIALFLSIVPEEYDAQRAIVLEARDLANTARVGFQSTTSLLKDAVKSLREER